MINRTVLRLILDQGVPRDAARFYVNSATTLLMWASFKCRGRPRKRYSLGQGKKTPPWVTLDADFHTILAISGASRPSVVRIRIEGLDARAMVELLSRILATYSSDLKRGAFVTVKSHKITQHRLPIGRPE